MNSSKLTVIKTFAGRYRLLNTAGINALLIFFIMCHHRYTVWRETLAAGKLANLQHKHIGKRKFGESLSEYVSENIFRKCLH